MIVNETKETIIKSALKYLVKMQIEEGSVGFAVDNDHDNDCCWDDVLAWIEAQPKVGRWIHWTDDRKDYVSCSCCAYGDEGEVLLRDITPYCPICGCKMDMEEETTVCDIS